MPGGGPKKTWQQMTRGEIVASLTAFTVIGGAIVGVCIRDLAVLDLGVMALLWFAAILFVVVGIGVSYVRALGELRRRKRR
jgi:hypothetical protein